jgi:ribonuclease G
VLRELIIKNTMGGAEIALLEDHQLVELHHQQPTQQFGLGDIFLGRVLKTTPALKAAFVDIGSEKEAFLHYTDLSPQIRSWMQFVKGVVAKTYRTHLLQNFELQPDIDKDGNIADVLSKRDLLLVQIDKEAYGSKGPRLSCEITLPGRYMVLTPFSKIVSVSRKIQENEERKRLSRIVEGIKPTNFGVIVRTAAEGRKANELHQEIEVLMARWRKIVESIGQNNGMAPVKVLQETNKTAGLLGDLLNETFDKIIVDDPNLYHDLKNNFALKHPELEKSVLLHNNNYATIFDHYKVTKQIKSLFGKTVNLNSGAHIVVEHTEAMHVIDVNSGQKINPNIDAEIHALTVNLEAASEIARQLRLRDLGGIIVIDFIDLKQSENREMVYRRMKDELQNDRAKHQILPLTKLGLMQMTRQRARPMLKLNNVLETCPTCKGAGKVKATLLLIDEIEDNLSYLFTELDYNNLHLWVHPFVAAYLKKGIPSLQQKWFVRHKKWVKIYADENYFLNEYRFFTDVNRNDEIKM